MVEWGKSVTPRVIGSALLSGGSWRTTQLCVCYRNHWAKPSYIALVSRIPWSLWSWVLTKNVLFILIALLRLRPFDWGCEMTNCYHVNMLCSWSYETDSSGWESKPSFVHHWHIYFWHFRISTMAVTCATTWKKSVIMRW